MVYLAAVGVGVPVGAREEKHGVEHAASVEAERREYLETACLADGDIVERGESQLHVAHTVGGETAGREACSVGCTAHVVGSEFEIEGGVASVGVARVPNAVASGYIEVGFGGIGAEAAEGGVGAGEGEGLEIGGETALTLAVAVFAIHLHEAGQGADEGGVDQTPGVVTVRGDIVYHFGVVAEPAQVFTQGRCLERCAEVIDVVACNCAYFHVGIAIIVSES